MAYEELRIEISSNTVEVKPYVSNEELRIEVSSTRSIEPYTGD